MTETTLKITVKPKSPHNEVVRVPEGVLVRVTAPPVEGAANAAVLKVLAEALELPKSRLTLAAGASGRVKRIIIHHLTREELDARLARLP